MYHIWSIESFFLIAQKFDPNFQWSLAFIVKYAFEIKNKNNHSFNNAVSSFNLQLIPEFVLHWGYEGDKIHIPGIHEKDCKFHEAWRPRGVQQWIAFEPRLETTAYITVVRKKLKGAGGTDGVTEIRRRVDVVSLREEEVDFGSTRTGWCEHPPVVGSKLPCRPF